MGKAWIDGAEAPLADAVAAAGRLLRQSRLPLVTGLGTDVAGVKAALVLARLSRGIVDHGASDVLYRTIEVLRGSGMFLAAPAEMRRRADRFLLIGVDAGEIAPDLLRFLFGGLRDLGRPAADGDGRKIAWLGAASAEGLVTNGIAVEAVPCDAAGLADAAAMIRAALGGRRFGDGPIAAAKAREIAAWLGGASFACAIWSAAALDRLGVEMVSGLVADLNQSTRASSLPLSGSGQAWGAAQIATSVAGFPLRVSFARGEAEHDPFAFETKRLLASGECDVVVHVSALEEYSPAAPDASGIPLIAVTGADAPPDGAAVAFSVGLPGRDHAGVLWRDEAGSFVAVGSGTGGKGGSAAEVLQAIAAELGDVGRDSGSLGRAA